MAGTISFCSDCTRSMREAHVLNGEGNQQKLVYDLLRSVAWECKSCSLDASRTTVTAPTYLDDRFSAMDLYMGTLPSPPIAPKSRAILGIVQQVVP